MDWDVERFGHEVARLQMLATMKYDEYGGYRPGVKFAENLARWLEQFQPDERETAFDFVMERLVFISDGEMAHLIEIAYPDFLEQQFLRWTAEDLGVPAYRVAAVSATPEFQAQRRRSLFLGLSDGARLDRLRRASGLSHEQFVQDYMIDPQQAAAGPQAELAKAMSKQELPGDATFRQIVLVDDFSGSGRTLLREDDDNPGAYKGKLLKVRDRVAAWVEAGVVTNDVRVVLLLYVASQQAVDHLRKLTPKVGLEDWKLDVVQILYPSVRVDATDPAMVELCRSYYDPGTYDEHKADTPIGYSDCALPLVLDHNTPNNSVCLLWSEPEVNDREAGGDDPRALFPRYERHHRDRP
jgi:hypothetical protein